jgi:hypothetical protein
MPGVLGWITERRRLALTRTGNRFERVEATRQTSPLFDEIVSLRSQ